MLRVHSFNWCIYLKVQRTLFSTMSAKSVKDGQHFPHKTGDVVLVKWRDGKIYFAKIKTIEWSKKRCVVIFDDKSQDLARFSWIHDGMCHGMSHYWQLLPPLCAIYSVSSETCLACS